MKPLRAFLSLIKSREIIFIARMVIGTIFIAAAIPKLADPKSFALVIANYKLIPPSAGLVMATLIPWMELLAGLGIITGYYIRGSAFVLIGLLVVFLFAIMAGILRGLDISCGCFTLDPAAGRIGWQKVAENVLMVAFLFLVYLYPSGVREPEHAVPLAPDPKEPH